MPLEMSRWMGLFDYYPLQVQVLVTQVNAFYSFHKTLKTSCQIENIVVFCYHEFDEKYPLWNKPFMCVNTLDGLLV